MKAFGRALRSPLIGFLLAGLAVPLLVLWAGRVDPGELLTVGTELVLASLVLNGIRFLAQGSRLYALLRASGIEIDLRRSVIISVIIRSSPSSSSVSTRGLLERRSP